MDQQRTTLDAIVIGLGFGGIYTLHKLRNELGLNARAFDKAAGIGGTWYWNKYPGACADTESFVYRYSFDQETFPGWDWHSRYIAQPQMQGYLQSVVERHQLMPHIQLNTTIVSAVYDEARHRWTVTTSTGECHTARYLVTAVGVLSKLVMPSIPGRERFKGRIVHTGAWPEDLSVAGKRVGVVGTGSTGVQLICAAAQVAKHVTVFQRSAQYCVPAGTPTVSKQFIADYRANFNKVWEQLRNTRIACGFEEGTLAAMSVSEQERERIFQEYWDAGNGFRFMFGAFGDIVVDPAANRAAADFIRRKIKEIVKDPDTACKLMPTDLYAKRPACVNGYYETFNRENVTLVHLPENPIRELTGDGVLTQDDVEHRLDVLAFATGFETVEGSYNQMSIHGRNGKTLRDHWQDQPSSFLGVAVAGFPNLFMVLGPNSAFSNLPPSIETQVEWIAGLIQSADSKGKGVVETTLAAEQDWTSVCREIANYTLFPQVKSWIFGENVPGRKGRVLFYFGGLAAYREKLKEVAAANYQGFRIDGLQPAGRVQDEPQQASIAPA